MVSTFIMQVIQECTEQGGSNSTQGAAIQAIIVGGFLTFIMHARRYLYKYLTIKQLHYGKICVAISF
jgi:hypothetical protein